MGKYVLIVDNSPVILRLCQAVLADMGYRLVSAGSGEAAWDILLEEADAINLLLTDIRMGPNMDGIELGARVRERLPLIKVIYMSGLSDGGQVPKTLESDSSLFLPKPFTVAELTRIVERAEALLPV